MTKDDCVHQCHDKELIQKASGFCIVSKALVCKAKHGCKDTLVCDCKLEFYCDHQVQNKDEGSADDYAIIDDSNDYLPTIEILAEKALKDKMKGSHRLFVVTKNDSQVDDHCHSLCSSKPVQKGCQFGHTCNVRSPDCLNIWFGCRQGDQKWTF